MQALCRHRATSTLSPKLSRYSFMMLQASFVSDLGSLMAFLQCSAVLLWYVCKCLAGQGMVHIEGIWATSPVPSSPLLASNLNQHAMPRGHPGVVQQVFLLSLIHCCAPINRHTNSAGDDTLESVERRYVKAAQIDLDITFLLSW